MTDFVVDTFADTAGTLLSAHTPGTGGTWTRYSADGHSGDQVITPAGRLRANSANPSRYYNTASPPSADYGVRGTVVFVSLVDNGPQLLVRAATGADTDYLLWYSLGSTRWELYEVVGATYTLIGTPYTQTFSASDSVVMELAVSGTSITAYIGGVSRITATNANITGAGQAGIRIHAATVGDDTGIHLADYAAGDVVGAGGGGAAARRIGLLGVG